MTKTIKVGNTVHNVSDKTASLIEKMITTFDSDEQQQNSTSVDDVSALPIAHRVIDGGESYDLVVRGVCVARFELEVEELFTQDGQVVATIDVMRCGVEFNNPGSLEATAIEYYFESASFEDLLTSFGEPDSSSHRYPEDWWESSLLQAVEDYRSYIVVLSTEVLDEAYEHLKDQFKSREQFVKAVGDDVLNEFIEFS